MKRALFAALCAMITALLLTGCNTDASDRQHDVTTYETKKIEEDGRIVREERYDANGTLAGNTILNEDGSISQVNEFDKNGNATLTEQYAGGQKVNATSNEFAEDGNLLKTTTVVYVNGEAKTEKITEYAKKDDGGKTVTESENGEVKAITDYNADGSITNKTTYTEDGSTVEHYENGSISRLDTLDAEGTLVQYVLNSYDEDGLQTKMERYNAAGVMTFYSNYEYKDGSVSVVYIYHADDSLWRKCIYDESGKVTTYDANGNVVAG